MFPGPQPPFSRGMSSRFTHPGMGHRSFFPGQRPNLGLGMRSNTGVRGGGFLARLFGRGGARSGMGLNSQALGSSMQTARGGGSFMQALSNPASINSFLSNTQKVLNTANQIGPMVQQYGPLVKNLPAMWKIYKGFKDSSKTENNPEESSNSTAASELKKEDKNVSSDEKLVKEENSKETSIKQNSQSFSTKSTKGKENKGESVPKLYI